MKEFLIGAKVALTILFTLAKNRDKLPSSGIFFTCNLQNLILNHFELIAGGFFGGYMTANLQFRDRRAEFLQMLPNMEQERLITCTNCAE